MSKEVWGWRDSSDDFVSGHPMVNAVLEASRSHDGWSCPHCGNKYTLTDAHCGEGVSNEEYFDLIENFEKVKMNCDDCGEDYYVRCLVTKRFYSCEDDTFGDD